ncbi:MAG: 23S rRNA (guanosine(2251)-2'-O)-methyltransferase RlmB [Chitinophagales bacterium]
MKKSSLIIGRQPLIEAMMAGQAIDKILMQKNLNGESIGQIRKLARENNIPIQMVPHEKLNAMVRTNHQGVIGIGAIIQYFDLQQVIDEVVSQGQAPLFLMLDGITDVRNIGALARTALCCGAQAMIIPDKGVGALNEEAMKSSAGALASIHVCRVGSLLKALDLLHLNGIRVFTSQLKATQQLIYLSFRDPCCIIMGSEDKGVQPFLIKAADEVFCIPMAGNFDSFNVSVAAGIILFEAMKQRMG